MYENKQHNTYLNEYNEAAALQQLLQALHSALDTQNKKFESDSEDLDQFTITVGGVQTAFYLGGPQSEAIYKFVQHVANENFYEVDIHNATVSE